MVIILPLLLFAQDEPLYPGIDLSTQDDQAEELIDIEALLNELSESSVGDPISCCNGTQCFWACIAGEFADNPLEMTQELATLYGCFGCSSGDVEDCVECVAEIFADIFDVTECKKDCKENRCAYGATECYDGSICFTQPEAQIDWGGDTFSVTYAQCVECPTVTWGEDGFFGHYFPPPTDYAAENPNAIGGGWKYGINVNGFAAEDLYIPGFGNFEFDFSSLDLEPGDIVEIDIYPTGIFAERCNAIQETFEFQCPQVDVEFKNGQLCMNVYYPEGNHPAFPLPFTFTAGLNNIPFAPGETTFVEVTEGEVCFDIPGDALESEEPFCMTIEMETLFCGDYDWMNNSELLCDVFETCDIPANEFGVQIVSEQGESPGGNDGSATIRIFGLENYEGGFIISTGSGENIYVEGPFENGQAIVTVPGLTQGSHNISVVNDEWCIEEVTVDIGVDCGGGISNFGDDDGGVQKGPNCILPIVMEAHAGESGELGSISLEAPPAPPGQPYANDLPSPLHVYWDDLEGSTTSTTRTDLEPGEYCATIYHVTDESCCIAYRCVEVPEPDCGEFMYLPAPVKPCANQENGSITIIPYGSMGAVSIEWANGTTGPVAEGLGAGWHSFTVTFGEANCTEVVEIYLPNAPTFNIGGNTNPASCANNFTDGSVYAFIVGGQPPGNWTYEWSNGQTGNHLEGVEAGTYTVTISNSNGCSVSRTFEVPRSTVGLSEATEGCLFVTRCNGQVVDSEPVEDFSNSNLIGTGSNLSCNLSGCTDGVPFSFPGTIFAQPAFDLNTPCEPCKFRVSCSGEGEQILKGVVDYSPGDGCCVVSAGEAWPNGTCGQCLFIVECKLLKYELGDYQVISKYEMIAEANPQDPFPEVPGEDNNPEWLGGCNTDSIGGGGGSESGYSGGETGGSLSDGTIQWETEDGVTGGGSGDGKGDGFMAPKSAIDDSWIYGWGLNTLFPNPFESEFNLNIYSDSERTLDIEIISVDGQVISREQVKVVTGNNDIQKRLHEKQGTGLYFLRISDETGQTKSLKLIKK